MDGPGLVLAGLTSGNLLIRLTVAGLVVFGSLYVLDSFGLPAMFGLAVLVAAGILIVARGSSPATRRAQSAAQQAAGVF